MINAITLPIIIVPSSISADILHYLCSARTLISERGCVGSEGASRSSDTKARIHR
jgi:hypothetical protein